MLQVAAFTLVMLLSYIVIGYYWKGSNWARVLVMVTSIVALLNLFAFEGASMLAQCVIVAEAALGLFLLVWLNTRRVRDFFQGANLTLDVNG